MWLIGLTKAEAVLHLAFELVHASFQLSLPDRRFDTPYDPLVVERLDEVIERAQLHDLDGAGNFLLPRESADGETARGREASHASINSSLTTLSVWTCCCRMDAARRYCSSCGLGAPTFP